MKTWAEWPVMVVEVVEYSDPWCSWAWGTEPKLRRLRWRYGDRLEWRTVMGDLVAGCVLLLEMLKPSAMSSLLSIAMLPTHR